MEERFYAMVFQNGHGAAVMEQYLAAQGLILRQMPTLRILSISCGASLRVESDMFPAVRRAAAGGPLDKSQYRFYFIRMDGGKPIANPV